MISFRRDLRGAPFFAATMWACIQKFVKKKPFPRHLDPMLFVGLAFTYGTLGLKRRIGPKRDEN